MSATKLGYEGQVAMHVDGQATGSSGPIQKFAAGAIALAVLLTGINAPAAFFPLPAQDEPDPQKKDDPKEEDRASPFSKDVKNIKEYELPENQLKEFYKGTRAHRKQDPELLKEDVKDTPKPTTEEARRFDDLRRQDVKKEEDLELIDKVIRRQVYSLSQPQRDWYAPNSEGRKSRDAIESMLDTGGGATERFMAAYKQSLLKYLPELLNNHLWVRINAMKLLCKMRDERVISLLCDQIQDPKQHESVKFLAIEGLELLGQKRLITQVHLESLAIQTLLDVLARPDAIHPFTRQQAVKALGSIARPYRVVGGDDMDVALELLKIVRDPNIRRPDRSEAVLLLANLQIPQQADYNYQYVAYEIAQFAVDVATAALADPTADDLHSNLYLVDAAYALTAERRPEKMSLVERAKRNPAASAKGDPAYVRMLGDQVNRLTVEALKVYKPDVVTTRNKPAVKAVDDVFKRASEIKEGLKGDFNRELAALTNMLKSKPPRSMKLTPTMDELGPPPALAGDKVASDSTADRTHATQDAASTNGTPTNGQSEP